MNNIKEDIEKGISEGKKIVFKVNSGSELFKILFVLNKFSFCKNYDDWIKNKEKLEKVFDNNLNVVELSSTSFNIYYDSSYKFEELKDEINEKLFASNYLEKMPRKKLIL